MTITTVIPPVVDFQTGIISGTEKLLKQTKLKDLQNVFSDHHAYSELDPETIIYSVEMLQPLMDNPGELCFGTSHVEPGQVGNEFYMTRGHLHERIECAEFYFGNEGEGLLILQDQQGEVCCEKVFPGSIHHIKGYIAHRLVNTGSARLSALAVWSIIAGHDYTALAKSGFNVRVFKEGNSYRLQSTAL